MFPRELLKKFIDNLVTTINLKKTLINKLISNSSQMKVLLHTSVRITNYLDPYSKVKIMGAN